MTDIDARLTKCFQAVFPNLPAEKIARATLDTVPEWDSIATATLLSLASEEFDVAIDFEIVERLNSFGSIRDYLAAAGAGEPGERGRPSSGNATTGPGGSSALS